MMTRPEITIQIFISAVIPDELGCLSLQEIKRLISTLKLIKKRRGPTKITLC